jgi:hypothetical protein
MSDSTLTVTRMGVNVRFDPLFTRMGECQFELLGESNLILLIS